MSTPRFKPLVESVIEETIIIEETVLLEETCTTLTEEIFEGICILLFRLFLYCKISVSANQNSGDIAKYLELLDFWKKKAIEELKEILDEYAHATKKLNQLQQKHFLTKSFPRFLLSTMFAFYS